jgi:hypothetical protein
MMTRFDDWEMRLDTFIQKRMKTPFRWGSHDCAIFAYDAVLMMTGIDIAERFRGKYSNKSEADQEMIGIAGGGLEEMVEFFAATHAMTEIERPFASRGDLALSHVQTAIGLDLPSLGIVGMSNLICAAGLFELQHFEIDKGERFWRL